MAEDTEEDDEDSLDEELDEEQLGFIFIFIFYCQLIK